MEATHEHEHAHEHAPQAVPSGARLRRPTPVLAGPASRPGCSATASGPVRPGAHMDQPTSRAAWLVIGTTYQAIHSNDWTPGPLERALRGAVRDVYVARFGESAATMIEEALPEGERQSLARALRSRPAGADTLSIVDYLYIKQLPVLLFRSEVQEEARRRLRLSHDAKPRLLTAIDQLAPVRNEIAHVREISSDRLLRASVACADVLDVLESRT